MIYSFTILGFYVPVLFDVHSIFSAYNALIALLYERYYINKDYYYYY